MDPSSHRGRVVTSVGAYGPRTNHGPVDGDRAGYLGCVIPGAQVTLTDESTGILRVVQTNRQGLYAFPALVPGTYTLKVTAKGFQPKEITGIDAARRRRAHHSRVYPDGGL